jgi:hypothetical protein
MRAVLMADALVIGAPALIVLCIVRIALLLRPPPGVKLPHPSKVPGVPMAGPATPTAAHAVLTRRSATRPWWKFW